MRGKGISGAGVARRTLVLLVLIAAVGYGSPAGRSDTVSFGYDVSYPQCGGSLPAGVGLAIVGVNAGLPFGANPCLGGADGELAWAGAGAQLYANTADPGPLLSSHWPDGETSPQQCDTASSPGADTASCSYDYGWYAASDSYADAVAGYVSAGLAPAGSTRTPQANMWWLDVETENSWQTTSANNVAALQGEVDYLMTVGVAGVGFYAAPSAWQSVTAGTTQFAASPFWLPGASSLIDAQSRCGALAPNGGSITFVQFPAQAANADAICALVPSLSISGVPSTLTAAARSRALTIQLEQGAAAPLDVSLASSSRGQFAPTVDGPWTARLTLSVQTGATATGRFYYRDKKPGEPQITASAPGYASAVKTLTVTKRVCRVRPAHDHGVEIAAAWAKTRSAAVRLRRSVVARLRADHTHARVAVEQEGCAHLEIAIHDGGHARAIKLLRLLRHTFHAAKLESR